MITELIDLYKYFGLKRKERQKGYLRFTSVGVSNEINKDRIYPSILILPGGGYNIVSEREGNPIALEYLYRGFNTYVLEYSTTSNHYPTQLIEASMAMIYIRETAQANNGNANKVAAVGFSAGGHLCGCISVLYNDENIIKTFGRERSLMVKPDATILCYAVLSSTSVCIHKGSFDRVSGGDEQLIKYLSLENHINSNTSPIFLWHTFEDNAVPVENSLLFALKCREMGVPFELHVYQWGRHGLASCNEKSDHIEKLTNHHKLSASWIDLSVNWLTTHNFSLNA